MAISDISLNEIKGKIGGTERREENWALTGRA